jgi:malate synthase
MQIVLREILWQWLRLKVVLKSRQDREMPDHMS